MQTSLSNTDRKRDLNQYKESKHGTRMIKIHKFKEVNLDGATVVDGFPTVGLVSTIAANYLIGTLKLDQICALDSPDFPPISMVYASKPKFPARIYADEDVKVAVFLSEFTPTSTLIRPIANAILEWALENKCQRIISPEGLSIPEREEDLGEDLHVYAACSSDHARNEIDKLGIPQLSTGIISGVSGILLNEGRRADFDVISLLAEVRQNMPDARAAAKIVETIDKLLPSVHIDVTPLYDEAEQIEEYLKGLRAQARKHAEPSATQHMYE